MSTLKGYDRRKKEINLSDSFPKDLWQIVVLDDSGRRVYTLESEEAESTFDGLDDTIGCEILSVEFSEIKETFMKLTDDQRNIVMHIYYTYKNNQKIIKQYDNGEVCEENPKIILHGPAGTGKSTVINLIEKLITWEENKTSDSPQKLKVLKCAFTGKAASNIEGRTLHSLFSIPIYKTTNLNKKRLESKQELLKNCLFFICDEISMVGQRLMSSVNMRLQEIFENNKLYGDRFVLLVGDLYQIDPVKEKTIYPKSELWRCCEFYELTKVIRQQDENFIKALINFRNSKMTEEDINLLRSREIQDTDEVPDLFIHLFYQNNRVDELNDAKLNKSTEKEEIVNNIDSDDWKPSYLRVKIGIRYMITYNMDVGDGLANGTTGVVKDFDYDENGCVHVIWMKFHSKVIGRKTRSNYSKKHSGPGSEYWVPIHRSKIVVKSSTDAKCSRTVPNMFPLKAAEAITVHKSQGQTYHDGVCVHLTNDSHDKLRTDKDLQYVALTRVKRLEDLYIIGTINYSVTKSDKFIRTENELNRLRTERKLKLAYETFEDKPGDVIIFLNTGLTFSEHHQFIATDKWYSNGSLMIFTETNTIRSDVIEIPNREIAYRSDYETSSRSGGGIICYKEAIKSVEVISSISYNENKIYLTLLLFEKYLYIVTGVKGHLNDDDFVHAIRELLSQHIKNNRCIFFIGNLDFNTTSTVTEFFKSMDFKAKLTCDILDKNEKSQCDVVFTRNFNIHPDRFGFYEYIPSSHKSIYAKLPSKSELLNDHGEIYSADYCGPSTSQKCEVRETMVVE